MSWLCVKIFSRVFFFFVSLDFVVKYLVWKMAQGQDKDIFGVLTQEDKLDGTNYSLWSFMVKNLLVAKNLWDCVFGDEVCPIAIAPATPCCSKG